MKSNKRKNIQTFVICLSFFFMMMPYSLSIDESTQSKCENNKIEYPIYANLNEYLAKENNIDNREIYTSIDDLKNKPVGINNKDIDTSKFTNISYYKTNDELINALKNHEVEAILLEYQTAKFNKINNNDLVILNEEVDSENSTLFITNKSNVIGPTIQSILQQYNPQEYFKYEFDKWFGVNFDQQVVDKNISGTNGKVTTMFFCENPPYCYKDKNGELTGVSVDITYTFAKATNTNVTILEAQSYSEPIQFLKNNSIDFAFSYLNDESKNLNSLNQFMNKQRYYPVIRYSNSINSTKSKSFYDSVEQLDGKTLGIIKDSAFVDITKEKFPNSKYIYYDDTIKSFEGLLMDEVDGFLDDHPNAQTFENRYPDRLTYFHGVNFLTNNYGFGFQKNDDGKKLLNQFNEFLKTLDKNQLYNKWLVADTSKLFVDRTVNESNPKLNVGLLFDTRPISFLETNIEKGYDLDIIYQFARAYNYSIDLSRIDVADRIDYIVNGNANITGGTFTITDERKKLIDFSDPSLSSNTSLNVRTNNMKDFIKIQVLDKDYKVTTDNTADIPVTIGNIVTTSQCKFPNNFSDTILINCTISDLKNADPYNNGLKYGNTTDNIRIGNLDYDLNYLINANSYLSSSNIIKESNKTEKICSNSSESNFKPITKSSSGLSKGGIIAIAIPCIAALLIAGGITMFLRKSTPPPTQNLEDMSLYRINNQSIQNNAIFAQQNVIPSNSVIQPNPIVMTTPAQANLVAQGNPVIVTSSPIVNN